MTYPRINRSAINGSEGNPPSGIMQTRYGKPSYRVEGGGGAQVLVPSLGVITRMGAPRIKPYTVVPSSMARTTRFGTPTWMQNSVVPGLEVIGVASLGRIARFGTPSVLPERLVVAGPIAPSTVFGVPRAGAAVHPPGLRATFYGTPSFGAALRVQGFCSAACGIPRAAAVVHAPSLPGTRYGAPSLGGFSVVAPVGFLRTAYGTPTIQRSVRVLPVAPSLRCGRPTIVRNAQC